jgi:protein tyrosine phosphatase (PTP) superfamily phosphohydrolase (DUF442 family)
MDANNTYQVFDWLWSSGQLSERDILELADKGFNVVINLALPSTSNALSGEAEMVTGQGIIYVQIPVEWEEPLTEQFMQFAQVMKAFSGLKIWVHCAMNMRVSVFIYLYRRLLLGESEKDASSIMSQIWSPNEIWQEFIRDVIENFAVGGKK